MTQGQVTVAADPRPKGSLIHCYLQGAGSHCLSGSKLMVLRATVVCRMLTATVKIAASSHKVSVLTLLRYGIVCRSADNCISSLAAICSCETR